MLSPASSSVGKRKRKALRARGTAAAGGTDVQEVPAQWDDMKVVQNITFYLFWAKGNTSLKQPSR